MTPQLSEFELPTIQVVGNGRVGRALVAALRGTGMSVPAPGHRGESGEGAEVVVLAVPDAAIAEAAAHIAPGRLVAHLSGATSLDSLSPHECFSLHPLTTVTTVTGVTSVSALAADPSVNAVADAESEPANPFQGAYAAVAASSDHAREIAERLAQALGMTPFSVAETDRSAYHAAASIASNFLVTLEWFAERLAGTAGVEREALVPLVTAAVRNWAAVGPESALTGPIARGDDETVARQRAAVEQRLPEHLELFDSLAAATRSLAARSER